MHPIIATHQYRNTAKRSAGVVKLAGSDSRKPGKELRSLDKYFWYTSFDGVTRLATSSGTLNEIPRQINDYVFDRAVFANDEYPSTLPAGAFWPPQEVRDLLCAVGSEGKECVGNTCYTNTVCEDHECRHTFEHWKATTQDWQDYFELRRTDDRGIGVYTRRIFKKGCVLGWYAGEIVTSASSHSNNDYLMEMPIGIASAPMSSYISDSDYEEQAPALPPSSESSSMEYVAGAGTVMIDASTKGNWTRFINHSCDHYTEFRMRRVGHMRIMAVEAVKDIPAEVELTVSYGEDYYGPNTKKHCYCGTARCVSCVRDEARDMWSTQKKEGKRMQANNATA